MSWSATSPPPAEPTLAAFPTPVLRYFAATRPAFLSVTFAAALLGLATAFVDGVTLKPLAAFFTVFFALVAHAGQSLAAGNRELSDRTEQQAANLEQTSASVQELTVAVDRNAQGAAQADALAGRVRGVAEAGGEAVQAAVRSMADIQAGSRRVRRSSA